MPKMIINLRPDVKQENFKNGDMLIYDSTKKEFYTVTQETFFDKYESKLNSLKKIYDKKIEEISKEKDEILEINKEFILKIQESNRKLIEMVENFIKGGK